MNGNSTLLLWRPANLPQTVDARARLLAPISEAGITGRLLLSDLPMPRWTILPLSERPLACLVVPDQPAADPTRLVTLYNKLCGTSQRLGLWRTQTSTPVDRPPAATDRPVVLLTLLRQHPELSRQRFMTEWHERHSPKAMRIHPLQRYLRHVPVGSPLASSAPLSGMVEEHYTNLRAILNPVSMFGGPWRWLSGMLEVGLHVRHFLDLDRCENLLMREYQLPE